MNLHPEYGVQYCNICGSEGYLCVNCSASSRLRAVMYVLGKCLDAGNLPVAAWKGNKRTRILESSGRSSYPMMLKDKFVTFKYNLQ